MTGAAPSRKPLLRRWPVRILLALVVLAVAGLLLRNLLIRKGLETAVTEVTGFPLAIDSFHIGLASARVEVGGLHLSNPPGFEDPRCLEVPRLVADVELSSAFGKELHVREIDLRVKEVVVVKNARGETNLDRLAALGDSGGDGKKAEGPRPGGGEPKAAPAKERKWRCDLLHLHLGRVVVRDFTAAKGGKPKEDVYDLGIDEEFRDVRGPGEIVRILVLKVLTKTPVKLLRASAERLAAGLADTLKSGVGGVVKGLGGAVEGVGKGLGGLLGGGGDDAKEQPPKPPPKRKR